MKTDSSKNGCGLSGLYGRDANVFCETNVAASRRRLPIVNPVG
jgi:hypothetical protein